MSVTAIAPDGSPYYRGKLPDAAPSPGAAGSGGSISFEVAPGKVQLRLAVESAASEVLDSEVREISIPDLTSLDVAIATPEVFRARTVREFQQLKAEPGARPTASREFSRAERVFVRISTYGSGAAAPTLSARLLNRAGQPMSDLQIVPAAAGAEGARDIDLTLSSLAAGEYLVEDHCDRRRFTRQGIRRLQNHELSTLVRAIAVAACLAGPVLFAQPAGAPVTLDVVVEETTAQRPPLSASDFTVTDDGEALAVESVRLVQPPPDTAPLPAVATDDDETRAVSQAGRLVGVYVDEYHLGDDNAFSVARDALARFLRSSLGPRDLVVVLKPLDSLLSLRMSSDREAAARIVEGAAPRLGDYAPRSVFEQEFIAGDPARIDTARNQIALSAVSAIATHLGRFEAGRKTLIVLSNGVSPAVPRRGDAPLPGVDSIARSANRSRVAILLDAAIQAHCGPRRLARQLRASPARRARVARGVDDRICDGWRRRDCVGVAARPERREPILRAHAQPIGARGRRAIPFGERHAAQAHVGRPRARGICPAPTGR